MKDPELPQTLEELNVIEEEFIKIDGNGDDEYIIKIEFKPTVPHCSLATLIGESLNFIPYCFCNHMIRMNKLLSHKNLKFGCKHQPS